jgi:hypothetical protein
MMVEEKLERHVIGFVESKDDEERRKALSEFDDYMEDGLQRGWSCICKLFSVANSIVAAGTPPQLVEHFEKSLIDMAEWVVAEPERSIRSRYGIECDDYPADIATLLRIPWLGDEAKIAIVVVRLNSGIGAKEYGRGYDGLAHYLNGV